jgi:DNA repair protein RadC
MYEIQVTNTSVKPDVRETLQSKGINHLTDIQLVMLLLGTGTKKHSVDKLAQEVINIIRTSNSDKLLKNLMKINGMGIGKASTICAALELGKRYNNFRGKKILEPRDVIPLVQIYTLQQQEHLLCFSLNGNNEIINLRVVSIGTVNKTIVHPREVFADPLKDRAAAIIVCHNHPSGNISPSDNDIEVTATLFEAGKLLGLEMLDHIIVSTTSFFSFREHNLLVK